MSWVLLCAGLALAVPATAGWLAAQTAPTESDIYCAGFFTRRAIEPSLSVQGSEDGGFKNEFADRDYVYLSKGRGTIAAPGGQYMLVRPVRDIHLRESFPGQHLSIRRLGTLYADVARIEVQVLHEGSATAQIVTSCEPVLAGDIAIPLNPRPAPPFKSARITDRFAPASGKATGVIVAAKDFDQWVGEGKIVYLNLGRNQGVQVGNYLRVFHTYMAGENNEFSKGASNYATEIRGAPIGRKLPPAEQATLPREVLGEVMVLAVEDESSTGIISYSRAEISLGDAVELE